MNIYALKLTRLDTIRPCVVSCEGYAIKGGVITVQRDYLYNYAFLIQKDNKNILIDCGLKELEVMNKPTIEAFNGCMVWSKEEGDDIANRLGEKGLSVEDIDYLILTHFHYDHASNADLFKNAKIIFHETAWNNAEKADFDLGPFYANDSLKYIQNRWENVICVKDNEEFLDGISMKYVGGHDNGCSAVVVKSGAGVIVFTSDAIQVYENLEKPVGVCSNLEEFINAASWVKQIADIVIPSHDPRILEKYPHGKIL